VVQPPHYDDTGNFHKSCIHSWAADGHWKRLTVRNSQAPWYTCFAHDQCRKECRAAFGAKSDGTTGSNMNSQQINLLLKAWYNGLKDKSEYNDLGSTILENIVKPSDSHYDSTKYFPR
jgi:hypothetical protein